MNEVNKSINMGIAYHVTTEGVHFISHHTWLSMTLESCLFLRVGVPGFRILYTKMGPEGASHSPLMTISQRALVIFFLTEPLGT